MSHEVEMIDGQAQMAYAGELPWHGLGTKVASDLAPSQIMQQAGLDWSVEKETMTTASGVEIEGKKALVRSSDNKVLDVVGDNWNPVQNSEAFEFFSEYCLAGDMEMHTAGSLKGGQMVWALAKGTAFNPESVKQTMGIAHEKFAQYKETCEFLASKKFNMNSLIQYYNEVFPRTYQGKQEVNVKEYNDLTNNAQKAFSFLETQPGAKFGEGSWWSALNSVTYLTDHKMGREADSRLTSAWFGANQTRKVKAVEKAVEFALAS